MENKKNNIDFTLNKEGRDIFRERIAKKLGDVDFNPDKRIKLSKDKLETLLFDYDEKKKCKKIGYTYEGLCKLDLSEISLENVDLESYHYVDLSNTNINIDFSKIYKDNDDKWFSISKINFSGIDLSGVNFDDSESYVFDDCDFSNTNFDFSTINLEFDDCNFTNNDFDGITLYCTSKQDQLVYEDQDICFYNCNFSNTGVKVLVGNYYKDDFNEAEANIVIGKLVNKNYLDGCIVNGHFIKTLEQKEREAKEIKEKYNKYISNYINGTLDMIDKQLSSEGGKMPKTLKNVPNNSEEI